MFDGFFTGASEDSIDAHCMNHYVLGLEHAGRTYNKKTKKSGSLSLKEKLKSKYLKNRATETRQKTVNSTTNKVLAVRAGEILNDSDNNQRNNESKKSTKLLNKKNSTKHNHVTRKEGKSGKEEYTSNQKDGSKGKQEQTPVKDNPSTKFDFNSTNKTKLMKKIKIKKKVSKVRKQLEKGIHLATNLRLESALALNLLSSEKFLSLKADETIDFYTFV